METPSHITGQNTTMPLAPSNIQQKVDCTNTSSSLCSKTDRYVMASHSETDTKLKSSLKRLKVEPQLEEKVVVETRHMHSISNLGNIQAGKDTADNQDNQSHQGKDHLEKTDENPRNKFHEEVSTEQNVFVIQVKG